MELLAYHLRDDAMSERSQTHSYLYFYILVQIDQIRKFDPGFLNICTFRNIMFFNISFKHMLLTNTR